MTYQPSFEYSEDALHALYGQHKINGCDGFDNFEGFRHSLIDLFDDSYSFLFHVFCRFDRFKFAFLQKLDEDEEDANLMADMIHLLGLNPWKYGLQDIDAQTPDIKLEVEEGCISVETFDKDSPYNFDLPDWAFSHFLENFTVDELLSLSEEEQDLFLRLFHMRGLEEFSDDMAESIHKRMVFGLHIPQNLKDYHNECAKELAARIITSPLIGDTIESFLKRKDHANDEALYFDTGKDKRFFVASLMGLLADIWQIPMPVEEDYVQTTEKDKGGEDFNTFMQALYRSKSDDEHEKIGLIFKINADKGYLPEANQNYYTVYALGHEFGHLFSFYNTLGQSHQPWLDDPAMVKIMQDNPFKNEDSVRGRFAQNNSGSKYYGAVKTDFTGLPKPDGKHVYAGQYEERHADYVGKAVRNMIEFAMKHRKGLRSYKHAKSEFFFGASQFMRKHNVLDLDPDLYSGMQQLIDKAESYEDLHRRIFDFIDTMAGWIEETMDNERGRSSEIQHIIEPIIEERGQKFSADLAEFTDCLNLFFEMRDRIFGHEYDCAIHEENTLSCA